MLAGGRTDTSPRVLVFSTNNISDPGIDMAGSAHMHYSTRVRVVSLPCSSGVKPSWVLHALENGFDGVFIAADGSDCAYLNDCTARTAKLLKQAQNLLKEHGKNPKRVKMAAVCSVCSESFVSHMANFQKDLANIAQE